MPEYFFILPVLYFLLVFYYIIGWLRLKPFNETDKSTGVRFSIIIPVRNEAGNIEALLNGILAQDYPPDMFDVILIDDDSEDDTNVLLENFIKRLNSSDPHFKYVRMEGESTPGKKKAIEKGISIAENDWIIVTDADTERGIKWLSSIAAFIKATNPVMVSAPVCFEKERHAFEKMQTLEFISLVGIGAACISNGTPTMCNGANLIYRKDVFWQVGGYEGNKQLASGDDEFLMHKMAVAFPERVKFLKSREAIVYTKAKPTLKEFLSQRKRWVSKSTHYKNITEILMVWLVWLFHLSILLGIVAGSFNPLWWKYSIISFILKFISELLFLISLSLFFNKKKWLGWFLPASVLYVFYVVLIALIARAGKFYWKGRKVN